MIRIAKMLTTLIIGLIAGPAVSLYGSPTVSPVTAAACANEPLPPRFPSSINFFALSQAPPPEVIAIATNRPVTIVPTSRPPSTTGPSCGITATATTKINGSNAGTIISRKAALATMATQGPSSGGCVTGQHAGVRLHSPSHATPAPRGALANALHGEPRKKDRRQPPGQKAN